MATPTRSGVVRPSWAWFALLDGGIVALVILASHEGAHTVASGASPVPLPSQVVCRYMLVGTAAIHMAEAAFAGPMARRRGLATRGWRTQTLTVGFPSLLALRRVPKPSALG
ncbi:MAG TPA: DUF4499 domain-containing protein [Acidimicrobiales bacterium]|jgi:hypothetical protein|nr:DUF4499 domain-containing protein [Acidimicrobiales bacterium]